MGRSRLHEHYSRVVREDMLTLFTKSAKLTALDVSVVLHGAQALSEETKYRAACILEILTGQRIAALPCNIDEEDPSQRSATDAQRRDIEKERTSSIHRAMAARTVKGKAAGAAAAAAAAATADLRRAGSGLKLVSQLRGVKMYHFLEKFREFYLPDVVGDNRLASLRASPLSTILPVEMQAQLQRAREEATSAQEGEAVRIYNRNRPPTCGHGNYYEDHGIRLHFQKPVQSKRDCYPPRFPLTNRENPELAISCYTVRTSDLLKFPDIEAHFEALGPILGGLSQSAQGGEAAGSGNTSSSLQLIIRPTLIIETPLSERAAAKQPYACNLRIFNYLLSQLFNPYFERPHVGGHGVQAPAAPSAAASAS